MTIGVQYAILIVKRMVNMYRVKVRGYDRFTGGVYEEQRKFKYFILAIFYYFLMCLIYGMAKIDKLE